MKWPDSRGVGKKYSPYPGFYDLRDFVLPKKLFIKLWGIQDMLAHMQARAEYFKKWHPGQWEKAKEISGAYQQILFRRGNTC